MKLYKIFFSTLFLLIISFNGIAQVEPSYSLYRYNTNFFNPAAFGSDDKVTIKTNFRSQFLGIDYAPETQSISLGIPIKDKMNVGVIVIADKVFIEQNTSLFASFSYKIQVAKATDLLFGIQAGGSFVNIDFEKLHLPADPFLSQNTNYFNPNIGVGFYLKNDNYFASLSVPRLFETDRVADENGVATQANNKAQLYVSGGYHFNLSDAITFIPSTLVRVSEEEIITDATGTFEFFKKFDVGVNYRWDRAIGGLLYITIKDRLKLGYAYESNSSDINKYENGTHEFGLSFQF
ncbi:type IX secretion system membrane protein PorP/SprF [Flavobacterium jejuense]|uniref:Type IX secretion system membrane protein PorP/SprF n=1 Tax=Flavobacterium jejuense TaxID=1544455 RepID=A0ABX0IT28_9FLAO|nr:PorP/SprF family type IX secretion system membrane protein [Flavobacterium jejuense]NHN24975.1 type IX secretion system membrane protein PorP/SprF [Flavobacterium jejuense]